MTTEIYRILSNALELEGLQPSFATLQMNGTTEEMIKAAIVFRNQGERVRMVNEAQAYYNIGLGIQQLDDRMKATFPNDGQHTRRIRETFQLTVKEVTNARQIYWIFRDHYQAIYHLSEEFTIRQIEQLRNTEFEEVLQSLERRYRPIYDLDE